MKQTISTTCDVNHKTWMNEAEVIAYMGFGNKDHLRQWREHGDLAFYKVRGRIIYKRTDIDKFIEQHRKEAFKTN